MSFQNTAGISIDDFLRLLKFYLESTFITFDQRFFSAESWYMHWILCRTSVV